MGEAIAPPPPRLGLSIGSYKVTGHIFAGQRSWVVTAFHASGDARVLKGYIKSALPPQLKEKVAREADIVRMLDHPNVVRAFDAWQDEKHVYISLEHCSRGDLTRVAELFPYKCVPETIVSKKIIEPVLRALSYLHGRGIIHRDIKPENIVVADSGDTKLCDFGLAIDTSAGMTPVSRVGTLEFMSPEIARLSRRPVGEKEWLRSHHVALYGPEVDIWSLGVTAFELLYGNTPFASGDTEEKVMQLILDDQPVFLPTFSRSLRRVSSRATGFLGKALTRLARARPSADALLESPWFRDEEEEEEEERRPAAASGAKAAPADAAPAPAPAKVQVGFAAPPLTPSGADRAPLRVAPGAGGRKGRVQDSPRSTLSLEDESPSMRGDGSGGSSETGSSSSAAAPAGDAPCVGGSAPAAGSVGRALLAAHQQKQQQQQAARPQAPGAGGAPSPPLRSGRPPPAAASPTSSGARPEQARRNPPPSGRPLRSMVGASSVTQLQSLLVREGLAELAIGGPAKPQSKAPAASGRGALPPAAQAQRPAGAAPLQLQHATARRASFPPSTTSAEDAAALLRPGAAHRPAAAPAAAAPALPASAALAPGGPKAPSALTAELRAAGPGRITDHDDDVVGELNSSGCGPRLAPRQSTSLMRQRSMSSSVLPGTKQAEAAEAAGAGSDGEGAGRRSEELQAVRGGSPPVEPRSFPLSENGAPARRPRRAGSRGSGRRLSNTGSGGGLFAKLGAAVASIFGGAGQGGGGGSIRSPAGGSIRSPAGGGPPTSASLPSLPYPPLSAIQASDREIARGRKSIADSDPDGDESPGELGDPASAPAPGRRPRAFSVDGGVAPRHGLAAGAGVAQSPATPAGSAGSSPQQRLRRAPLPPPSPSSSARKAQGRGEASPEELHSRRQAFGASA